MLIYDSELNMFEYRGINSNSFFFSLLSARKQMKEIYNVDIRTFLN